MITRRDLLQRSLAGGIALHSDAAAGFGAQDAEADPVTKWATLAAYGFRHYPNHEQERLAGPDIVYTRANNIDLKLDVIVAGADTAPRPTLMYIHGGGWAHLIKEDRTLYLLPYLAQGMNTVNIEYRVANQSPAPAAVEDCRSALHWVHQHAQEYGFDKTKLVVAGESAGGNLALMTGMLNPEAGFDGAGAYTVGNGPVSVAAIVNFFGVTDVAAFLEGSYQPPWALEWFANVPNPVELAKRCSPLSYVRPGLPPIITIHGEADRGVPYEQGVRLHEALDRAGVPNQLVTIPHGGHGCEHWPQEEQLRAQMAVFKFLREHGVL